MKTSNTININVVEPSSTGITLFYMIGLLLALTGCAALVIRRRMSL